MLFSLAIISFHSHDHLGDHKEACIHDQHKDDQKTKNQENQDCTICFLFHKQTTNRFDVFSWESSNHEIEFNLILLIKPQISYTLKLKFGKGLRAPPVQHLTLIA